MAGWLAFLLRIVREAIPSSTGGRIVGSPMLSVQRIGPSLALAAAGSARILTREGGSARPASRHPTG